ncbi:ribonuclease H-like domain-containing protein [Crassisporium funariophilum]|nr:ribonuclease H-like domain-containing protein [Crassisporium funariophilum]
MSYKGGRTESSFTTLPIPILKAILKYFSKSSFGTFKLREAQTLGDKDGPVNALQKIGKTRFGTHWLAANAIDPCLPFIRDLVIAKTIKFKNTQVQGLFANKFNRKYNDFGEDLLWYITVVAPLIRSLWSLEAAHANAADVFIFWLASAATLKDLFDKDIEKTGIPQSLANEVTAIYNKRYKEFFKHDIYFVAFLLDPRYPIDKFLKPTISLPLHGSRSSAPAAPQLFTMKYRRAYEQLRNYLRDMLKPMLEQIQGSTDPSVGHPVLREKGVSMSVSDLKHQIELFWNGEYPFRVIDCDKIADPLDWWREIGRSDVAKVLSVLAIRIFSILVNSMPDERTNSAITWFNSPLRGNQMTQTIVDEIQIGQYYGKHNPETATPHKKERFRPAVKFRKIDKALLERLQTGAPKSDTTTSAQAEPHETEDNDSHDEASKPKEVSTEEQPEASSTAEEEGSVESGKQKLAFVIDPQIDINSRALLDMISEEAVVMDKPLLSASLKVAANGAGMTVDEAFDNW